MQTVLLVEDEPRLLAAFQEVLEAKGYRVLGAGSSEAAIDACNAAAEIDILVSDVVLGEMDGFTVAAIVKSLHQNVAVVLMSGSATPPSLTCRIHCELLLLVLYSNYHI